MKMSRRALRMDKQHRRKKNLPELNLVALMDIFTILVFFLLVNVSGIQPQGAAIVLPESAAEKLPKETLIITVSNKDIILQGRRVADVEMVMASEERVIPGLQEELNYHANKKRVFDTASGDGAKDERPVTIMGDKEIPYMLLKRIMMTCAKTGFTQVSLAVTRAAKKGAGS